MLRPRLRIPQAGALLRRTALGARSLHHVPRLDQFRPEEGVPGLLSPAGYQTAWTDYMNLITEKLNYLTAGTEYEQMEALNILKVTARDPSSAALFNYASMAHNNHFYFKQLANLQHMYQRKVAEAQAEAQRQAEAAAGGADEDGNIVARATDAKAPAEITIESSEERIPPKLRYELEQHFSSIETLRREIYTAAMGMFGPGFVWLVRNAVSREMRIVNTYLAGTPYTAAHWRRQGVDFNTAAGAKSTVQSYFERTATGAGNGGGRFAPQAPGGTDVIPVLCLNTWEHVWLTDYGINGKSQYIQQWWESIDWDRVEALAVLKQRDTFRI